ncbi:MAG: 23S rRNA (pseudouridine(1915)-N(3))-methyltransferase RlmH [Lachnospiraceae bacterium]|nr:23S rRNA (pseudouridine(1915)-N(3))-methyltransferase RlmH [Lachnospiraceae bacterium]
MKITILTVGKIKEKYFTDAIKEYSKRLSRYTKLDIIEVSDEPTPDNAGEAICDKIKETEGQRLLKHIPENAYVITLEINGKNLSSEELSKKINDLTLTGNSNICFIIGGSLGLHKSVLDKSNFALSFSKMTFPHQLMRVILLEQIYRAFKIIKNEPYHK